MNVAQSANMVTYVAAAILLKTSSVNVPGISPLTASVISRRAQTILEVPHTLCKNVITVAVLMCDALLRHFRRRMFHRGIGGCVLLSLLYS